MSRLPNVERMRLERLIQDLKREPTKYKLGYLCTESLRVYHQYDDREYLDLVGNLAFSYQHLYKI